MQIKEKFPEINEYLLSLNADICRPLEFVWVDFDNENKIKYMSCQYVVFGSCEDEFTKKEAILNLLKIHISTQAQEFRKNILYLISVRLCWIK